MVKRTRFLCGLMASQLLSLNHAFASPQQEIDHLLTFVESTQCKYERNGTIHTGPEAAAHIKRKLIITPTRLSLLKISSRIQQQKVC